MGDRPPRDRHRRPLRAPRRGAVVGRRLPLGAIGLAVRLLTAATDQRCSPRPRRPGAGDRARRGCAGGMRALRPLRPDDLDIRGTWSPPRPGLALAIGAAARPGPRYLRAAPSPSLSAGSRSARPNAATTTTTAPTTPRRWTSSTASGPPDSPIAESTVSIWGPQTPLEAALGPPTSKARGAPRAGGRRRPAAKGCRRSRSATRTSMPASRCCSGPPVTRHRTATEQARRVGRLARGGTIFFVGLESAPVGLVPVPGRPPEQFVQALPARIPARRDPASSPVSPPTRCRSSSSGAAEPGSGRSRLGCRL